MANLSREERVGLGIAALLHVALVAALVWHVQDDPTPLPIPERMDVSLATEVSLQATAPDPSAAPQAAVAPVLAPEPEPVVEPVVERVPEPVVRPSPEPRPTATRPVVRPSPEPPNPQPRPTARATPRPQPTATARPRPQPSASPAARPAPRPTPTQATRGGGSRLGADFLEGTSSGERSDARGTPAAAFGPAEQASLQQAINRELRPHWSAPQGVDAEKLVTVLTWDLKPDGSLDGRPRVVRQSGETDSNRPQKDLHAERAIRAVQLAAPFDLPEEFYSRWKRLTWTFDRNLSR